MAGTPIDEKQVRIDLTRGVLRRDRGRLLLRTFIRLPVNRNLDQEGRALSDATLSVDLSTVLINDAVGDRQAETGASPLLFRRKERIENAL